MNTNSDLPRKQNLIVCDALVSYMRELGELMADLSPVSTSHKRMERKLSQCVHLFEYFMGKSRE